MDTYATWFGRHRRIVASALCCVALLAALVGDLVILPALLVSFCRAPTR